MPADPVSRLSIGSLSADTANEAAKIINPCEKQALREVAEGYMPGTAGGLLGKRRMIEEDITIEEDPPNKRQKRDAGGAIKDEDVDTDTNTDASSRWLTIEWDSVFSVPEDAEDRLSATLDTLTEASNFYQFLKASNNELQQRYERAKKDLVITGQRVKTNQHMINTFPAYRKEMATIIAQI